MIEIVRDILQDSDLFVKKLEESDTGVKGYSYSLGREPYAKWEVSQNVLAGDAFVVLFSLWIKGQKMELPSMSAKDLLVKLFGTPVFSDLKLEVVRDQNLFQAMEPHLIDDYGDEIIRLKNLKSMKKAAAISIECKTGAVLYFGKTSRFYFLISSGYMKKSWFPIGKSIDEILFAEKLCENVRKRPGMYVVSINKRGLHPLVTGLIEDLLQDAEEKVISLKLLPDNVFEIICRSYSPESNTRYFNHLAIASALGEFFEYQDEEQKIRMEKGVLVSRALSSTVSKGVRIVWKADCSIFQNTELDYFILLARLTELAALNPYVLYLSDRENLNKICIPAGISYLLKRDNLPDFSVKTLSIPITHELFTGSAAVSFSAFYGDIRKSYVNSQATEEGGTHVEGLFMGVRKALERILASYDNSLTPGDLMKHLNYVIHIQIEKPRWQGSTKRRLKNIEVKAAIGQQVEREVYAFLKEDIEPLKAIYFSLF